jgi:predicted transcriptional regulator
MEDELTVYDLVREYLKKKALSSLEEILDFIAHRLKSNKNINRTRILIALKSLMKQNLIMPGSKLVKDDILTIPKRVEILDHITAMPGTNIKEIMEYNEIGSSHAVWHLKYLKKFEFIRSVKFGNQKAYFKAEFEEKYDEIFFYLRNTKVKKIIKLLKEQKSVNPTEISNQLNIHYNTIKKYLHILKKFNLLQEIDEEHKKEYLLNQDMFKVIQEVIDKLK